MSIARAIAAITEDRRCDYLFHTKSAAAAVGCHPNKFSDWWFRTRAKLIELHLDQPGQLAAELAALIAAAEDLRSADLRSAEPRAKEGAGDPGPRTHGVRRRRIDPPRDGRLTAQSR
jgi:hypothetical protein